MKKKYSTLLSLIIIITLTAVAANPIPSSINLGAQLVKETRIEEMIKQCIDYHFTEISPEDGYTVFLHPDGSKLRFKITDTAATVTIVEIITYQKQKEINTLLTGMGYKKAKSGYEQRSSMNKISSKCQIIGNNPRTVTFTKSSKTQ